MSAHADLTSALVASVGGDEVAVILGLQPAWFGARASGPAFTVQGSPGDNLALHCALAEAGADDVIVLSVSGCRDCAHLGDIMARAAQYRNIAAIVVDGATRDRTSLAAIRFPVFHSGSSPRKPAKEVAGLLGVAVKLYDAIVNPADFVIADDDGVVIVPAARAEQIINAAYELEAREREVIVGISAGKTTRQIYDL